MGQYTKINIDALYEQKNAQILHRMLTEGVFSHLIAGVIGFLLGKRTGMVIQGKEDNIKRFNDALDRIKKDLDNEILNMSPEEVKRLAKKYNVSLEREK